MEKNVDNTNPTPKKDEINENTNPKGYPLYSPEQDVYSKYRKEEDLNPEDISKTKEPNEESPSEKNSEALLLLYRGNILSPLHLCSGLLYLIIASFNV